MAGTKREAYMRPNLTGKNELLLAEVKFHSTKSPYYLSLLWNHSGSLPAWFTRSLVIRQNRVYPTFCNSHPPALMRIAKSQTLQGA
jgi:hypothetical protein